MEIQRESNESTNEWRENNQQQLHVERTPEEKRRFMYNVVSKKTGDTSETSTPNSSSSSDVDDNCFYYGPEKRANTEYNSSKKDEELINSLSPILTESLTSSTTNKSPSSTNSDSPETSSDELICNRTRSSDNCAPSRITRQKKTALIKAFGWKWKKASSTLTYKSWNMKQVKGDQMLWEKYKASTNVYRTMEPLTNRGLSEIEYAGQNTSDALEDISNEDAINSSDDEFMVIPPAGSPTISVYSQDNNNNDNNIVSSGSPTSSPNKDKPNRVKRRKVLPLRIIKKRKSQCENSVPNISEVALKNKTDVIQNTCLSSNILNHGLNICDDTINLKYLKRKNRKINSRITELNESNDVDDSEDFTGFTINEVAFSSKMHDEVCSKLGGWIRNIPNTIETIPNLIQTTSNIEINRAIAPQQNPELFPRLAPNQKRCNKIFCIDYDVRYIELINEPIFHPLYLKRSLKISHNLNHNRHLMELKEIPEKCTKKFSVVEYFSTHRVLYDPIKRVILLVERFSRFILHAEIVRINYSGNKLRLYTTQKIREDLCDENNVIKIIPDHEFTEVDEAYILKATLNQKGLLKAFVPTFIKLEDNLNISDSENLINWDDAESVVSFASETNSIYANENNYEYSPDSLKLSKDFNIMLPPDNRLLNSGTSSQQFKKNKAVPKLPDVTSTEHNSIPKKTLKRKHDQKVPLEHPNVTKVGKYLKNNARSTEPLRHSPAPQHDSIIKICESEIFDLSQKASEDTLNHPENLVLEAIRESQITSVPNVREITGHFENNETYSENSNLITSSELEPIMKPEISRENKRSSSENLNSRQNDSTRDRLLKTIDQTPLEVVNLPEICEKIKKNKTAEDLDILENQQNILTVSEIIKPHFAENTAVPLKITDTSLIDHNSNLETKYEKEDSIISPHSKTVCDKSELNIIFKEIDKNPSKTLNAIVLSPNETKSILNRILLSINKTSSILLDHTYAARFMETKNEENNQTITNSTVSDQAVSVKPVIDISSNISSIRTFEESTNSTVKVDFTYLLNKWQKCNNRQILSEMTHEFHKILFDSQPVIRRQRNEDKVNHEISFRKRSSSDKTPMYIRNILKDVEDNRKLGKANKENHVNNESSSIIEDTCRENVVELTDYQSKLPYLVGSEDLGAADTGNELNIIYVSSCEMAPLFEDDIGNNEMPHTSKEIEDIVTDKIKFLQDKTTDTSKQIENIEEIDIDKKINIVQDRAAKPVKDIEERDVDKEIIIVKDIEETDMVKEIVVVEEIGMNKEIILVEDIEETDMDKEIIVVDDIEEIDMNKGIVVEDIEETDMDKEIVVVDNIEEINMDKEITVVGMDNELIAVEDVEGTEVHNKINIVEANPPKMKVISQDNGKELSEDGFKNIYIISVYSIDGPEDIDIENNSIDVFTINQQPDEEILLIDDSQKRIQDLTARDVSKNIDKEDKNVHISDEIDVDNSSCSSNTKLTENLSTTDSGSEDIRIRCRNIVEIDNISASKFKDIFRTLITETADMLYRWLDEFQIKLKSDVEFLTKNSSSTPTQRNNKKLKVYKRIDNFFTRNAVFIVKYFRTDITKILRTIVYLSLIQSHTLEKTISALVITFNYIYIQLTCETSKDTEQFYINILCDEEFQVFQLSGDMQQYSKKYVPINNLDLHKFIQNCEEENANKFIVLPPQVASNLKHIKRLIFEENQTKTCKPNDALHIIEESGNEDYTISNAKKESERYSEIKQTIQEGKHTNDNEKEYLNNYDSVIDKIKSWASRSIATPSMSLSNNISEINRNIKGFIQVVMSNIKPNDFFIENEDYCLSTNTDNSINIEQNKNIQKQAKLNKFIPVQLVKSYDYKCSKKTNSYQNTFSYMQKYIMESRLMMAIIRNNINKFLFRPIHKNNVPYEVYEIEVRKGEQTKLFLYKVDKVDINNKDEELETVDLTIPLLNNVEENKARSNIEYDFKIEKETNANDLQIENIINKWEEELLDRKASVNHLKNEFLNKMKENKALTNIEYDLKTEKVANENDLQLKDIVSSEKKFMDIEEGVHDLGIQFLNKIEEIKASTNINNDLEIAEESESKIENNLRIKDSVSVEPNLLDTEENMDVNKAREILYMHEEMMRMQEIHLFTEEQVHRIEDSKEEVDQSVANDCEYIKGRNTLKDDSSIDDDDDPSKLIIVLDEENTDLLEEKCTDISHAKTNLNAQYDQTTTKNSKILQTLYEVESQINNRLEQNRLEIFALQNSIVKNVAQNAKISTQSIQSSDTNDIKIIGDNWSNNVTTTNLNRKSPKINVISVEIIKSKIMPTLRESVIKSTNSVDEISKKVTASELKTNSPEICRDKNDIINNTNKNATQSIDKPLLIREDFMNIQSSRTPICGKDVVQKRSHNNLIDKGINRRTLNIDESKNQLDLILGEKVDENVYNMMDQITTKTGLTITRIPKTSELNIEKLVNKDNPNFSGKENNKDIKRKKTLTELINVLFHKAAIKSTENQQKNNNSDKSENNIINIPHSIRNILNLNDNDEPIVDNSNKNKLGNKNYCANKIRSEPVKIDEKINKPIEKQTNRTASFKSDKLKDIEKVYVKDIQEFERNLQILHEYTSKQITIFYWFIRNRRELNKKPMYDLITFFKMLKNGELRYYKADFENYCKFRRCQNN